MSEKEAAHRRHLMWKLIVPTLIVAALAALATGIWLPMLHTDKLLQDTSTYSVVTGIKDLFSHGKPPLALLILFFSVLFPAAKLVTLGIVWFRGPELALGERTVVALRVLSKWSMLDVFAVGTFVGTVRLGILADAREGYGIYVFGGAILLAMIVTYMVSWLLEHQGGSEPRGIHKKMPIPVLIIAALAGFFAVGAITQPLMQVEKWFFWKNTYTLLSGARQLIAQGAPILGIALCLFVIILPLLALVGWAILWVGSRLGKRMPGLTETTLVLDEWAMMDVFALAVFVVVIRVGDTANVTPLTGMWLMAAAGPLFILLSWLGRRSVRS